MTTKLDPPSQRELSIGGKLFMLTIAQDALHLVPKGKRNGYDLAWMDLVSGDAALATALNASLAHGPKWKAEKAAVTSTKPKTKRSRRRPSKR